MKKLWRDLGAATTGAVTLLIGAVFFYWLGSLTAPGGNAAERIFNGGALIFILICGWFGLVIFGRIVRALIRRRGRIF